MRAITKQAVNALLSGGKLSKQNMRVANNEMYLHGNLIAKKENGKLFITNAGWFSNTTKERLNGLPNVSISQRNGIWYLNGKEWDGKLIEIKL